MIHTIKMNQTCECGNNVFKVDCRISPDNLCDKDQVKCECGSSGLIETDGATSKIKWMVDNQ